MLNRRLIRVKVFQAFYAYTQDEDKSLNKANAYLKDSLEGIYSNFRTVFIFPLELIHYIRTKQNPEDNRYIKDADTQLRYEALCLNGLYESIVHQPEIATLLERPPFNWQRDEELLLAMYREVAEAELTDKMMANDWKSAEVQMKFLQRLYTHLETSERFNHAMEEMEMLWEDEKVPVFKFVRTAISDYKAGEGLNLPAGIDSESEEFALDLLKISARHAEEYAVMIDANAPGWDRDRIAKTDMLIMTMALAELLEFPYIPIKVTLNEYLELAKNYSTPQSNKFVNGVLDKAVKQLKAENRLVKKGRGLVG
ncbi:MAG: transcription antitermination factor NusB [Flavobacteriales bacterium]|nr:transcription antitermination factor NusB [Bacteroidota bacterium]MCB9241779.1 transcription antitermination factor NusB [Flavobacteriales bacterium]